MLTSPFLVIRFLMTDEKIFRRLCLKVDKAESAPREKGREFRMEKAKNY